MKKAFTLIELLIVISLIAVSTSFIVTGTRHSNMVQGQKAAAAGLRSIILEAKANAQSGRKNCLACGAAGGVCGAAGDTSLSGWRVIIQQNPNNRYMLRGYCNNFTNNFYTSSWFTMPTGVTFTSTSNSIIFRPGEPSVTGLPATITFSASGVPNLVLTINQFGEVL